MKFIQNIKDDLNGKSEKLSTATVVLLLFIAFAPAYPIGWALDEAGDGIRPDQMPMVGLTLWWLTLGNIFQYLKNHLSRK